MLAPKESKCLNSLIFKFDRILLNNREDKPVSTKQSKGRGWRRALSVTLLAIVCASATACNEPMFLTPAPTLRGITIPLPPPSFADEIMLYIDVSGNVPFGYQHEDTKAYLKEKRTGRGYFVNLDGGDLTTYTIQDVLIDVNDNCLETWFVDGADDQPSPAVDYRAVLLEGDEACADPTCSAMDEQGMCLCLEKWPAGC